MIFPPYPIIPMAFDDSLSFYELLSKSIGGINKLSETKQDKLIAGDHIKIEDGVISTSIIDSTYVRMADDPEGGVDLRVDFTTRKLALQDDYNKTSDKVVKNENDVAILGARMTKAESDIDQIAGSQIPSSVIQNAVSSYVSTHSGELATKQEVQNVKDNIDEFTIPSKNLFDREARTIGYELNTNGELTANSSRAVSDYIPVTPGNHYISDYGNKVMYTAGRVCFYTSGKVFLSMLENVNAFNAPAGSAYVRIQISENRADFYQLEEGNTMTPFSEYHLRVSPDSLPEAYILKLASGVRYVSTTGSDDNDGSKDSPFATVQKAIESGASFVFIHPGEYSQSVRITRLYQYTDHLTIFGYGAKFTDGYIGNGGIFDIRLGNVEIYGVECALSSTYRAQLEGQSPVPNVSGFFIAGCNAKLSGCKVSNCVYMGFRVDGSNITLENCTAHMNGVDGINAHSIELDGTLYETNLRAIDCISRYNGDDGLSTHEHSVALVKGGEYTDNVQAGIAPYGFARYRIENTILRRNQYGIEAFDSSYHVGDSTEIYSLNNLIMENTTGIYGAYYEVVSSGDVFAGNTANIRTGTEGKIHIYN